MKRSTLIITDEKEQLKNECLSMIEECRNNLRDFSTEEQEIYNNKMNQIEALNEELRVLNEELKNKELNSKNTTTMKQRFSILNAIRSVANNKQLDAISQAVVDEGAAEMRKAGLSYVGQIQLPSVEDRALTVATEHDDVVATDMMDIVRPLQARNVLVQAGAKYLSNLVGDLRYPVMSSVNTTWEGETTKAGDQNVTFTSITFSPKRLTCVVPISKQFLVQDSAGAEQAIREEIINAINAKLEATILGDGDGMNAGQQTAPKGLFNILGTGAVKQIAKFEDLCNLESECEEANLYGDMKYLLSPKAKAGLRGMAKSGTANGLVYENNEVDGTQSLSTSHLKDKKLVYGDFSQMVIAQWSNLDLLVDSVTLSSEAQIRLVVNAYFDAKPLRNEAFKVATIK